MNSRVYQSSGRKNETNGDDEKYFSQYVPRRLGAEALLDAMCDATGVPEKFSGFPAGTRGATAGRRVHVRVAAGVRPAGASERLRVRADTDTTLHMAMMLQGGDFIQFSERLKQAHGPRSASSKLTDRAVSRGVVSCRDPVSAYQQRRRRWTISLGFVARETKHGSRKEKFRRRDARTPQSPGIPVSTLTVPRHRILPLWIRFDTSVP